MKLKQFLSGHKEVVILFAVPVLMTLLVGAFVVVPSLFDKPSYDFVYLKCDNACPYSLDFLTNNDLNERRDRFNFYDYEPEIHIYYLASESSEPISWQTYNSLELDRSVNSPDGYSLQRGGSSGGSFLFGSYDSYDNYDNYYLEKDSVLSKLNLSRIAGGDIKFVGWVINER